MEIRFGLSQELLSIGFLSRDDYDEISCKKFVVRKKEKLLEIILHRKDVEQLVDFRIALERTGQQHVLNYLDWDGGEFFILFFLSALSRFCFRWRMNDMFVAGLLI